MKREGSIDIVRGIAIVTILLNHFAMTYRALGYAGTTIPTPTQLGYSSAASVFVALSGYMVGMVYLRRLEPIRAVLRRAWDLYLVNLAVFIIVLPVALVADPAKDRFWYMQILVNRPIEGIWRFMTLRDAPAFLDVLQLYIVLLLITPLAILLMRKSRWLLAAASIGLWAAIQFWPFVMPAHMPPPAIGRTLNALAWQMAFFLPMIAGAARIHEPVFAWFRRNPAIVVGIVALLVVAAYTHDRNLMLASDWRTHLALTNRPVHGPVWTAHALLLMAGYFGALAFLRPWQNVLPFRLLASLGRNSLNVYAASIPLIFASAILIGWARVDDTGYLLGIIAVVLGSVGVAAWGDARKERRRPMPHDPVPQPA